MLKNLDQDYQNALECDSEDLLLIWDEYVEELDAETQRAEDRVDKRNGERRPKKEQSSLRLPPNSQSIGTSGVRRLPNPATKLSGSIQGPGDQGQREKGQGKSLSQEGSPGPQHQEHADDSDVQFQDTDS